MENDKKEKVIELLKQYYLVLTNDCSIIEDACSSVMGIVERIYGDKCFHYTTLDTVRRYASVGKSNQASLGVYRQTPDTLQRTAQNTIKSLMREIESMGIPSRATKGGFSINQTVSQTQEQHQGQMLFVNLLSESIKDEISEEQWQQLVDAYNSGNSRTDKKSRFFEKLQSFGEGISASILANVLTNKDLWALLVG